MVFKTVSKTEVLQTSTGLSSSWLGSVVAALHHTAHARAHFVTHVVSRILQEDATEHVGAVLKRVKHEYLVSAERYQLH